MNEQNVTLDLSRNVIPNQIVRMGQGDVGGTTIVATILDNCVPVTLSGMTAKFVMRMPHGKGFAEGDCTISDNKVRYVVDESHFATVSGYTDDAYFVLRSSGKEYSTARFRVQVLRDASEGTSPTQAWTNGVDEWLDGASAKLGATINAANAAVKGMRDDVDDAIGDLGDVVERAEDAIDAMGDISELAVPLMTGDIRGGAKLGDGLAITDGSLHVGALAKASDGEVYGPLASASAHGWAEQVSTTGKNLFSESEYVTNASGGTTKTASYMPTVQSGDTMYVTILAIDGSTVNSSNASLRFINTNDEVLQSIGPNRSFLVESAAASATKLAVYTTSALAGKTIRVQLELGSTATAYEPYTGGLPSPRPDWPQEIQVARGRNLLDGASLNWKNNWTIDSSGNEVSNSAFMYTQEYVAVKPNETYSLQFNKTSVDSTETVVAEYDSGKTFVSRLSAIGSSSSTGIKTGSFTTGVTTRFIRIACSKLTVWHQLTLGSTPQPYVPYGHVGMEVQGRNLLDVSKSVDGKVVNSNTGAEASNASYRHSDYTPVKANSTYYMSNGLGIGTMYSGAIYDANKQYLRGIALPGANNQSGPFDTGEDAAYVILNYVVPTHARYVAPPQLELGSVAHDYVPYYHTTTPIPLPSRGWVAGLPDGTADVLRLDGAGKVEWTKNTGEVSYDGSVDEDWYIDGTDTSEKKRSFIAFTDSVVPCSTDKGGKALCDRFRLVADTTTHSASTVGFTIASNQHIYFGHGGAYNTDGDWRTFLSTHPVTVLYPLATPVTEDMGYIDLPDIPGDATVTIPELEDFGCTFWVDDSGAIHALAAAYEQRTLAEVAEARTAALANVASVEGDKASTNYAQGTYLVHDGKLCKVTSAIATGETIAIGTNVAATTVAAEILAINA